MKKSIIIILTLSILFISGCKRTDKKQDNNKQDTNNTVTEPENNADNNDVDNELPIENMDKYLTLEVIKMESENDNTTIEVKVKNISNETYVNTTVKIILLDEQEREITNFTKKIDRIEGQEEKTISVTGKVEKSKIKRINYEIVN